MKLGLLFCILLLLTSSTYSQQTGLLDLELLAYTDALQDRIIIYDVRNQAKRELQLGEGLHNIWGFSPDGCRILFSLTSANGLSHIYTSRLDGTGIVDLVQYDELSPAQWGAWEPQWSSNDIIAFKMVRDGLEDTEERQYHIAYVSSNGSEPIFYSVTGREHSPQWSPNGEWLAYISYDERIPGADISSTAEPDTPDTQNQISEADLWVVSADSETKYRLTNFAVGSVGMPKWSPDNDLISFVYSPSPNNNTFWIVGNSEGAISTQLSFIWNLTLATTWLPDSSAILASARDIKGYPENHLWKIPIVGNVDETAELLLDDDRFLHTDYPAFNATGDKLAFRSDYAVIIYDLTDSSYTRIADDFGNTPMFWSPEIYNGEGSCDL